MENSRNCGKCAYKTVIGGRDDNHTRNKHKIQRKAVRQSKNSNLKNVWLPAWLGSMHWMINGIVLKVGECTVNSKCYFSLRSSLEAAALLGFRVWHWLHSASVEKGTACSTTACIIEKLCVWRTSLDSDIIGLWWFHLGGPTTGSKTQDQLPSLY